MGGKGGNRRHGATARLPPCAALSLGHAPPRDRAAPPHQGRLRRQSAEDRRRAGADREARSAGGPGGVSRDRHVRLFRRRGRPGRGGDGGDAVPRSHGPARGTGMDEEGIRLPASVVRWERILRGMADEHGVWVAFASLVGFEGGKGFPGGSVVVSPAGDIVLRGPLFEEAVLTYDVDFE